MLKSSGVDNVAIIGLGLLGTSLSMALEGSCNRIGWTRRKEVRNSLLNEGKIDETSDSLDDVLAKADLTIICLPIPMIMSFCKENRDKFKAGSVVTDIGSVKEVIVLTAEEVFQNTNVEFVGSHPMAGTEKSGPDNAFKDLYDNAAIFVTPTENSTEENVNKVKALWQTIGTRPVEISVKEHDNLVAHTSHISHVMSLAITLAVLDCDKEMEKFRYDGCASGFRDTTRITSSNPQMWREIIENNQPAVLETVKNVEKEWQEIGRVIENKEYDKLEELFAKGKSLRDTWMTYRYNQ